MREAGAHALLDQRSLELREDVENLEHGPARWRASVEALLMQVEVDALGVQLAQVLERSAEAIEGPCGHHLELAEQPVEPRPAISTFGAADAVKAFREK